MPKREYTIGSYAREERKHCNGCSTYKVKINDRHNDKTLLCGYSYDNIDGICPCTNCIIKVMCEHMCTAFITFAERMKHNA